MEGCKKNKGKKYLLISAKPAPNGELHLGHLSGPFLSQDMYYRQLTANGDDVKVISGTDAIDSFVHLKASQQKCEQEKLATENHQAILDNFDGFSFHYDCFIDPLSRQWYSDFVGTMAEVVDKSIAQGKSLIKDVPFPFSEDGEPASGALIVGICPDCGADMSGYFCEDCSAHLDPTEILSYNHRDSSKNLLMLKKQDVFFQISKPENLLQQLSDSGVRDHELKIVAKQFEHGRQQVRLTEWSNWGIEVRVPHIENESTSKYKSNHVYFGHGLLYAYCRLIGKAYQEKFGTSHNPFDEGSDVTTINFFGVDNTVSHMVNIQAVGEEMPGWKGFDHFVVNHFYLLDGLKFSTSAGHLISGGQIISDELINAEGVRFVLAATSPASEQADFTRKTFLQWHNDVLVHEILGSIRAAHNTMLNKSFSYQDLDESFEDHWQQLMASYEFTNFDPRKVVSLLRQFCARCQYIDDSDVNAIGSWLSQMTLLLYPLMPSLASRIWISLGSVGTPCKSSITQLRGPINNIDYGIQIIKPQQLKVHFTGRRYAK